MMQNGNAHSEEIVEPSHQGGDGINGGEIVYKKETTTVIKAGTIVRVPAKLEKSARYKTNRNTLGVWAAPGDSNVWLEVRAGVLLHVLGRAQLVGGEKWRRVGSADGRIEGYCKEKALSTCIIMQPFEKPKRIKATSTTIEYPSVFDWAYVGVKAKKTDATLGQCIAIDTTFLPDPDHVGLATFRMKDGRTRKAWLIHTVKTEIQNVID